MKRDVVVDNPGEWSVHSPPHIILQVLNHVKYFSCVIGESGKTRR